MPAERLSMRKMKEVLRLYFGLRLSKRQVARSCNISPSTVVEYIGRAELAGLGWPLPDDIDDAALESLLFAEERAGRWLPRPEPEYAVLHRELRRKGVTLELLWQEYKDRYPEGYEYSQFCLRYRQWAKKLDVTLRQQYRAGEKLFVDFAGKTVEVIDPHTGEITDCQIFVGVLGASNYTYAEAVADQRLASWCRCHVNMFEYFGGVAETMNRRSIRPIINLLATTVRQSFPHADSNRKTRPRRSRRCRSPRGGFWRRFVTIPFSALRS